MVGTLLDILMKIWNKCLGLIGELANIAGEVKGLKKTAEELQRQLDEQKRAASQDKAELEKRTQRIEDLTNDLHRRVNSLEADIKHFDHDLDRIDQDVRSVRDRLLASEPVSLDERTKFERKFRKQQRQLDSMLEVINKSRRENSGCNSAELVAVLELLNGTSRKIAGKRNSLNSLLERLKSAEK